MTTLAASAPITLYAWNTPNGLKPAILLEELGLAYDIVPIDIGKGDQHAPSFRALNPNGKIPALVDGDVTLFESGAILLHLADKHDAFLPKDGQARADVLSWTFWQVGGLGPMMGQWGHFTRAPEAVPQAIERYLAESLRLLEVMEGRLQANAFLGGEAYSIADMMSYPWVAGGYRLLQKAPQERLPKLDAVRAWAESIGARPAVQAAKARFSG